MLMFALKLNCLKMRRIRDLNEDRQEEIKVKGSSIGNIKLDSNEIVTVEIEFDL